MRFDSCIQSSLKRLLSAFQTPMLSMSKKGIVMFQSQDHYFLHWFEPWCEIFLGYRCWFSKNFNLLTNIWTMRLSDTKKESSMKILPHISSEDVIFTILVFVLKGVNLQTSWSSSYSLCQTSTILKAIELLLKKPIMKYLGIVCYSFLNKCTYFHICQYLRVISRLGLI